MHAREGEEVTLRVAAKGVPKPMISWHHQGRRMKNDYATVLEEDGSLKFVCVEGRHAGVYNFTATNTLGSVEGTRTLVVETEAEQEKGGGNEYVTVENNRIDVGQFGEYVEGLHAGNNSGFNAQYQV